MCILSFTDNQLEIGIVSHGNILKSKGKQVLSNVKKSLPKLKRVNSDFIALFLSPHKSTPYGISIIFKILSSQG